MRLYPGAALAHAEEVLKEAETAWGNARGGTSNGYVNVYLDTIDRTYRRLKQVFITPDLASSVRSAAYWHLLPEMREGLTTKVTKDPLVAMGWHQSGRPLNDAIKAEIDNLVESLASARAEFEVLKALAGRPGLPVVCDTNMLIHWRRPSEVRWSEMLRARGESARQARIVVPLRVVDELDRQKYGAGPLASRAGRALRYLQETLTGRAGDAVSIRDDATLEIWTHTDERSGDADSAILDVAGDLNTLCAATGARVLTGDLGMQLRADVMGLKTLLLPDEYRKQEPTAAQAAGAPVPLP
jgi:hypothetical protein